MANLEKLMAWVGEDGPVRLDAVISKGTATAIGLDTKGRRDSVDCSLRVNLKTKVVRSNGEVLPWTPAMEKFLEELLIEQAVEQELARQDAEAARRRYERAKETVLEAIKD